MVPVIIYAGKLVYAKAVIKSVSFSAVSDVNMV
jgi:hypothetical protein